MDARPLTQQHQLPAVCPPIDPLHVFSPPCSPSFPVVSNTTPQRPHTTPHTFPHPPLPHRRGVPKTKGSRGVLDQRTFRKSHVYFGINQGNLVELACQAKSWAKLRCVANNLKKAETECQKTVLLSEL